MITAAARKWLTGLAIAAAIAAVGADVIASSATASSDPSRSGSDGRAAQEALAMWKGFPASARPRPVIVAGEGSVLAPVGGFSTGASKMAFLDGRYVLKARLPAPLSRFDGYQVISAAAGYRLLRSDVSPTPDRGRVRLSIRGVRLGRAVFETDRGRSDLPAWQFFLAGVADPADVLAIASSDLYATPRLRKLAAGVGDSEDESATVSPNGKRLTVSFIGAQAGTKPCDASYGASALADRNAVVVTITTTSSPAVPAGEACDLVGYRRTAVIDLAKPLGGRVLVANTDGAAITVTEQR